MSLLCNPYWEDNVETRAVIIPPHSPCGFIALLHSALIASVLHLTPVDIHSKTIVRGTYFCTNLFEKCSSGKQKPFPSRTLRTLKDTLLIRDVISMITKKKCWTQKTRYFFGHFLLIYLGVENMETWQSKKNQVRKILRN